jgi:hypothetical protein
VDLGRVIGLVVEGIVPVCLVADLVGEEVSVGGVENVVDEGIELVCTPVLSQP